MKIPKAFGTPIELNAFRADAAAAVAQAPNKPVSHERAQWSSSSRTVMAAAMNKIEADGGPSKWWLELSDESKAEYVAEHPASKYADFHAKEQHDKTKPPSPAKPQSPGPGSGMGHENEPKHEAPAPKHEAPAPKKEGPPQVRNHDKGHQKPKPGHNGASPSGIRDHSSPAKPSAPAPAPKPDHTEAPAPAKPGLKDFSHPDMKAGGEKRKAIAAFLRRKTGDIISHVKHEGKEWKTAGLALKKLATGKGLEKGDKHALGSVAADLAAVTASLMVGGGAAHGIAAFMHHFGSHLAQEMLIKAAVKGAAGAAHHASIITSASQEDDIMKEAVKMMLEAMENGDLEAMAKKYEAEAAKEGKAEKAPGGKHHASVLHADSTTLTAKLDMSAEVAGRGFCPECKGQMQIVSVAGSPSWACTRDRISLPIPDDHEYHQKEGRSLVG